MDRTNIDFDALFPENAENPQTPENAPKEPVLQPIPQENNAPVIEDPNTPTPAEPPADDPNAPQDPRTPQNVHPAVERIQMRKRQEEIQRENEELRRQLAELRNPPQRPQQPTQTTDEEDYSYFNNLSEDQIKALTAVVDANRKQYQELEQRLSPVIEEREALNVVNRFDQDTAAFNAQNNLPQDWLADYAVRTYSMASAEYAAMTGNQLSMGEFRAALTRNMQQLYSQGANPAEVYYAKYQAMAAQAQNTQPTATQPQLQPTHNVAAVKQRTSGMAGTGRTTATETSAAQTAKDFVRGKISRETLVGAYFS